MKDNLSIETTKLVYRMPTEKQPTSPHGKRLKKRTVSWQDSRSFMAGKSEFGLRKLESPQKAQIKNELRAVSAALNHRHTGK